MALRPANLLVEGLLRAPCRQARSTKLSSCVPLVRVSLGLHKCAHQLIDVACVIRTSMPFESAAPLDN